MQCPRCQQENPPQAKFCLECGARLARACASCGTELPASAKFCLECGQPAGMPPGPAPQPPAPQTYTPKHLAERILTSRGALEGERKQVTVLFADLKGSMELLADRDPEEARRILDPVLERMMDAVHRYEGTVNQVMGDGIMALFGAPLAHEDHAVRACYAALRMQEGVKEYAQEVQRTEGLPLQIRVGLNSGEVVVRSIGSDLCMDYSAIGQTTHLAARMEQLAMPGSILLAPDALQLAEGYVQVRALGPMQVKGLSEPVEVYELLGAGLARSRLQAAAARGLTRFVGRDAELGTLRRTLEQAGGGHGQIVALVGEPGVGKSRLVWEFGHSHRTQGWLVLESGSVSYGKATSYLPVIDLLKSYCGIESRDDPRRIREKLTGKLLTLDPALQPTLPAFLALLDLPVDPAGADRSSAGARTDDPTWAALDPPQRRQRTLDACKRLLLRESQEQPLLLVFEDLHWIDAETQALLDSLVDSLPTARILLLVNYRPEYEHTWHRKTYYQQLRLDPLPPESAEELLLALVGNAAELQPLKRVLIERTEGNPFFVEESVHTLVEAGVLAGDRGAYRLAKAFESAQVPATVQAVLAARIDRLGPEDKRLLQAAAVIGKDVPYSLLQAIAELPEEQLRQGLARLQAAEFLYETSLFPELEYTFKHALTHEVAYSSLLQERRRALDARIVEAIERLYPDRLVERVERLAHHAFRGEVWDKAVAYLRQAGEKANGRSAHSEAVAYFEQALAALAHLPESRETREQVIDLHLEARSSLLPLGQLGRMLDHLREAETLARALGDPRRVGRAAVDMATSFWLMGDYARAVEFGQRALSIAEALGNLAVQVEANTRLGQVHLFMGDYPRAADLLRRSVVSLEAHPIGERSAQMRLGPGRNAPSVTTRSWLVWALAERGVFSEGIGVGEEGVRIATAVGHPWSIMRAHVGVGYLYLRKGDLEKAIATLERSLAVCEDSYLPIWFPFVASACGSAYVLAGRVADALPLLERAGQQAATVWPGVQAICLVALSHGYLLAGRTDEAIPVGGRALGLAHQRQERGHEAWALRLLGEIAAHPDPPNVEQAEGYYHEALALADELGMRPLVAHCHLGLGTLYQRVGRAEQARAELATAAELYRAMDMPLWLAKAETVLAQVGV
jgi:class 3 adenylate cyclase/tetratricopeptide (TPR) repeat protein